jgi:hypothetical protein
LFSLKDYLPKKPSDVEVKVIKEMFEASVAGEPFDMDRWGQYFKPAGMSSATGDPNTVKAAPKAAPVVADDDEAPWEQPAAKAAPAPKAEESKPAAGGSKAEDILAMIRNRNK